MNIQEARQQFISAALCGLLASGRETYTKYPIKTCLLCIQFADNLINELTKNDSIPDQPQK